MKLVSKVFRPGGSVHELDGKRYHFKELNAAADSKHDNPGIPHVCDVKDTAARDRFIETGGFTIYDEDSGAAGDPVIARPPGGKHGGTGDGTGDGGAEVSAEKVAELRDLSIAALKESIGTYTDDELAAALEAEQADTKPRAGFVEAIKAHLGK